MKKTLLTTPPIGVPQNIERLIRGADVYDSSCSPEARVYYIDRDGGYFLKRATVGTLAREAQMTAYFHKLGLGAEVLDYASGEFDWLLTSRVIGEDCTHADYLSSPERLCDTIATTLRGLHEMDAPDCPVPDRTAEYLAFAEKNYTSGNYDKSHFPDSFGYASAEEAWRVLSEGRSALKSDALIHGDYCLPNIMLDGWKPSGFVDVGNGGVGDRHIDVFWGIWTLWFNLGTDRYRDRFIDAYGRDKIDENILKIIAAAEVFG